MRNTYISFDRLQAGSYFEARGKIWVKGPAKMRQAGVSFNSYDARAITKVIDIKRDPIAVELFPGEMLVKYNPNEKRALWSYEPKKAGE